MPSTFEPQFRVFYRRIYAAILYGFIGSVCTLVTFNWHVENSSLPTWDGGQYALTALQISESLRANVWLGFTDLYLNRIFRPISFPSLSSLVFTPLSSFSINIKVGIVQTLCTFLAGIACYKIARVYLTNFPSFVISCFLISMPWLLEYSREYFYSEPMWLGSLAWYLKNQDDYFRKRQLRDLIISGVSLGIAFTLRPVETILFIAVPMLWWLIEERRAGLLPANSRRIPYVLFLAVAFTLLHWKLGTSHILGITGFFGQWFTVFAIAIYVLVTQDSLMKLYSIAFIIAMSWFAGFTAMTLDWIYLSSFGSWAKLSNLTYLDKSFVYPILKEFQYYAPRTSVFILLFVVITLVYRRIQFGNTYFRLESEKKATEYFTLSMLTFFPTLVMIATSRAADPRKIMASMFFSLLFGLIAATSSLKRKSRVLFVATIFTLLALQVLYSQISIKQIEIRPLWTQRLEQQFGILRPPNTQQDPNYILDDWVSELVGDNKKIGIYSHGLLATDTYIGANLPIVNPTGLSLASYSRKNSNLYSYSAGLLFDSKSPSGTLGQLRHQGYDFVLLDMYAGPIGKEVNRAQGYFQTTSKLLTFLKYQNGTRICSNVLNREFCLFELKDYKGDHDAP